MQNKTKTASVAVAWAVNLGGRTLLKLHCPLFTCTPLFNIMPDYNDTDDRRKTVVL